MRLAVQVRHLRRGVAVARDGIGGHGPLEVPPRVEYRRTERGHTLNEATCAMWLWVEANAVAVHQSRRAYDEAAGAIAE